MHVSVGHFAFLVVFSKAAWRESCHLGSSTSTLALHPHLRDSLAWRSSVEKTVKGSICHLLTEEEMVAPSVLRPVGGVKPCDLPLPIKAHADR